MQLPISADNAPGGRHNGTMVRTPVVREADIAVPDYIRAAVADASRPQPDRDLDTHRKPGKLFAFMGLEPGQRVGELMCASGFNVVAEADTGFAMPFRSLAGIAVFPG